MKSFVTRFHEREIGLNYSRVCTNKPIPKSHGEEAMQLSVDGVDGDELRMKGKANAESKPMAERVRVTAHHRWMEERRHLVD